MNKSEAVSIEAPFSFERSHLWEQFSFSEPQGMAYTETAAALSTVALLWLPHSKRSQVPSSPEC